MLRCLGNFWVDNPALERHCHMEAAPELPPPPLLEHVAERDPGDDEGDRYEAADGRQDGDGELPHATGPGIRTPRPRR